MAHRNTRTLDNKQGDNVTRPYAGQAWTANAFQQGIPATSSLEIIARDLRDEAIKTGITATNLELWEKDGTKGFFTCDTSPLAEKWTLLAKLF